MPVFTYRARTLAGSAEQGLIDAESLRAAWHALRARGVFPTALEPGDRLVPGPPLTAHDRAAVLRDLAILVRAGVPIADALAEVEASTHSRVVKHALTLVRARVREGARLADAITACPTVFPRLERELIRAGEESGVLADVLSRLAASGQAAAARGARMRRALVYPAIMLVTTAGVVAFLLGWVVPEVTRLFAESGAPLPLATRAVIGGTAALRATWWCWILVAALAGIAWQRARAVPATHQRLDTLALRLPVAGALMSALATARIARVMATALSNGLSVIDGLDLATAAAGNARIATAVGAAREAIRRGDTVHDALVATGVFPTVLCRVVATGERSGELATAFEHAADTCEAQVETRLDALVTALEPALVIVMGLVVLAVVLAILVPLLTMDPLGAHR